MLNGIKNELLCVRGNCDTEVDQMVLDFPILAEYCLLELDGHTIFATHGHNFNPDNFPMLKDGDYFLWVIVFGKIISWTVVEKVTKKQKPVGSFPMVSLNHFAAIISGTVDV